MFTGHYGNYCYSEGCLGALYIVQVKSDFWRNVTVWFRLLLHDN